MNDSPIQRELMVWAADFKRQVQQAQHELAEQEVTAQAGGGLVTVVMRGTGEVVDVVFDQSALDSPVDAAELGRLTLSALHRAAESARSAAAERLSADRLLGGD